MIIVAGKLPIQADKREGARQIFETMAHETRKEEGCLSYEFFFAIENESDVFVFEEWENLETLAAHGKTAHMATFRGHLQRIMAGPGAVKRYEVSPGSPL